MLQGMSNSSGAQVGARIPADVELHEYQKESFHILQGSEN